MTGINDIITYSMSDVAILQTLSEQIKLMRLNKNITQTELSKKSGVSRSAISEMENGKPGTIQNLIQVLRALEKLELLNIFAVEHAISPLQ